MNTFWESFVHNGNFNQCSTRAHATRLQRFLWTCRWHCLFPTHQVNGCSVGILQTGVTNQISSIHFVQSNWSTLYVKLQKDIQEPVRVSSIIFTILYFIFGPIPRLEVLGNKKLELELVDRNISIHVN